jgi:hypothetical protein
MRKVRKTNGMVVVGNIFLHECVRFPNLDTNSGGDLVSTFLELEIACIREFAR